MSFSFETWNDSEALGSLRSSDDSQKSLKGTYALDEMESFKGNEI